MLKANNCFVRSIWKQSMSKSFHNKRPNLQSNPNPNKRFTSFKNATAWPSSSHKVVKFLHPQKQAPFNVNQICQRFQCNFVDMHTNYHENCFQTKVELSSSEDAEKLWRSCLQQLPWGVLSVEPEFYYTLKRTNGKNDTPSKNYNDSRMQKTHKNNQNGSKNIYEEYWSDEKVKEALDKGELLQAALRINPKNPRFSFITDPNSKDIMMETREDRNRALDGDIVAVQIRDEKDWVDLNSSRAQNKKLDTSFDISQLDSSILSMKLTDEADSSNLKRKTGKVVAIIKQVRSRISCGSFEPDKSEDGKQKSKFVLMQPTDHTLPKVAIPRKDYEAECKKQNVSNVMFAYKIVSWEHYSRWPLGELCKVIGDKGSIDAETERILIDCEVDDTEFTQEVIDCLPTSGQQWSISKKERSKRADYTKHCIFSIDPPHARDLDDALHCIRTDDGNYEVGVHIADVSHFVKPNTPLDDVASNRATSVYLVQRVVPMLPRLLCEQLCSLNPDVERLAFSVVWKMNKRGEILDQYMGRSVIKSCAKLSYDHAQSFIDGTSDQVVGFPQISAPHTMQHLSEKVNDLHMLAQILRQKRIDNGSLKLEQVKLNYTLDSETGTPNGCYTYTYKKSNELIEEFMLLANMSVAHRLRKKLPGFAFLRGHPPPKEDMMDTMVHNCRAIGLEIDAKNSKTLSNSIATACGDDELAKFRKMALFMLAIKPQQQAMYLCTGVHEDESDYHHYALSVPLYTHFTSPIRRYADLIVHRQLAATLNDRSDMEAMKADADLLESQAKLCNDRKNFAKQAGDLSVKLFFKLFVKSFGPLESNAMVLDIHDHSLDVLSMEYGVLKRVYIDAAPVLSYKYGEKDAPGGNQKQYNIKIKWPLELTKEAKPCGTEPPTYESCGKGIEREYKIFDQINITLKADDKAIPDGFRVYLKPPQEVRLLE